MSEQNIRNLYCLMKSVEQYALMMETSSKGLEKVIKSSMEIVDLAISGGDGYMKFTLKDTKRGKFSWILRQTENTSYELTKGYYTSLKGKKYSIHS
jgi:hypothetical protein